MKKHDQRYHKLHSISQKDDIKTEIKGRALLCGLLFTTM